MRPTTPQAPAPPGRPVPPPAAGVLRRWWPLFAAGAGALALVLVAGVALLVFWPRGTRTAAPGAAGPSPAAVPDTLAPRSGAPHTTTTFGGLGGSRTLQICGELDLSSLKAVFGTPVPAGTGPGQGTCSPAFTKAGAPSPTRSPSMAGTTTPGVNVNVRPFSTPAEAEKHAADLYRTDHVSSWNQAIRVLDFGDMGYVYRPRVTGDDAYGTNRAILCVVTGNLQIFVEAIDPAAKPAWSADTTGKALTALSAFGRANLHLFERTV